MNEPVKKRKYIDRRFEEDKALRIFIAEFDRPIKAEEAKDAPYAEGLPLGNLLSEAHHRDQRRDRPDKLLRFKRPGSKRWLYYVSMRTSLTGKDKADILASNILEIEEKKFKVNKYLDMIEVYIRKVRNEFKIIKKNDEKMKREFKAFSEEYLQGN